MKKISTIFILIMLSVNNYSQVEIPSNGCKCKKIKEKQFTLCIDSANYQTIWTANKISKYDIENRIFFPPDNDFFPGIANIDMQTWSKLENQVKYWAMEFDSVFVVTGRAFINDSCEVNNKRYYYKAVLKGCQGDAIGFLIGNSQPGIDLISCAVPIDSLERITGMDYYPSLNKELQNIIESSFNADFWPVSIP